MALGFSLLATDADTANATSYADTESTQPAAGSALLWGIWSHVSGAANPSSVSAYGVTWNIVHQIANGNGTLTVYEGYAGGSPSASNATVNFAANQAGCVFDIIEITGADTTDFTVQAVENSGTGTSSTNTLASFADATNNGAVSFTGTAVNAAITPDATATWNEHGDSGINSPTARLQSQSRTGQDTTVTSSWTGSATWAQIAVEVAVASSNVLDEYGFADETDAAMPFSADSDLIDDYGFASETDAAMPFAATIEVLDEYGFASETDAAMPFNADSDILDDYGFADETDSAMPFSADSELIDDYGFATETDSAMPFDAVALQEVAFDASTDLGTATTGALTGTHTPVDDPSGVVVKIVHGDVTTDLITGVTYGGVPLDRIGTAVDDATEPGRCYLYFLGSGIPTGAQTVTVSHTGTATVKWANVESYTAAEDTTIAATWHNDNMGLQDDLYSASIFTEQMALRTGVVYSGKANVSDLTLLTGMTAVEDLDFTNYIARADRQTTASAGRFDYGYTGTVDDFAAFTAALVGVSTVPTTPLGLVSTHVYTWATITDPSFGVYSPAAEGAIMFVGMYGTPDATDFFTSATYGAAAFTEYAHAVDTVGETGHQYGLYAPNVSGSDTISMVSASNTTARVAVVFCTASSVSLIDSGQDDETQANPSDALDSGAEDAIRFGFIFSGLAAASSLAPSNLPDEVLTLDGLNAVATRLDADLTPTAGNITVGWTSASDDVAAVYGAFAEGDIVDTYGYAEETDTAMPFSADSEIIDDYGFAGETDSAMPFESAVDQTDEYGFAEETDEAMPFEATFDINDEYGYAEETDTAMPFLAEAEEPSPEESPSPPDEGSPTSPEESPVDSPIIDSPDEDSPDEPPFESPVVSPDDLCFPVFMARRSC